MNTASLDVRSQKYFFSFIYNAPVVYSKIDAFPISSKRKKVYKFGTILSQQESLSDSQINKRNNRRKIIVAVIPDKQKFHPLPIEDLHML